jgi:aryl-alcohol dehydrogenase-like predicted oxidoreductase
MTSSIIGATTMAQLAINIGSAELVLNDEILEDIFQIYRKNPMPF